MRIKEGFVLRRVMGNNVAVAVGEASKDFHGMVKLNDTAADIWRLIEKGHSEDEICDILLEEYEVEREKLSADIKACIAELHSNGILEL